MGDLGQVSDPSLDERIKDILIKGISPPDTESRLEHLRCEFIPTTRVALDTKGGHTELSKDDRAAFLTKFCYRLFDATSVIETHFEELDKVFSELFTFRVYLQSEQTVQQITNEVRKFLGRLPEQPLGLPGVDKLPDHCLNKELRDNIVSGSGKITHTDAEEQLRNYTRFSLLWPCLKVTSYYSTNVLRIIIFREIYQQQGSDGVEEKQLVDLTAELLDTCCKLENELVGQEKRAHNRWLVVRCFLWASWQRTQLLYFYRILYFQLVLGVGTNLGSLTVLRSTMLAPGLTIQQFSDQVAFTGKSPYMCSWAFNLLRTDGIAVGSDFRLLHMRFNQLLGHNEGRCDDNSSKPCDGSQLGNCKRFSIEIEDQSMHDHACLGDCPKLTWDEDSYRSVEGGRTVDVINSDYEHGKLKYRAASNKTLAITHAWAHGQGGRPSTGLNLCLHIRYAQLAQQYGCDGYFLDTACIPDDYRLRREAIMNINETFENAKITLVVDKDLLTVDVSETYLELQECLLAAILVSDWNCRAWTLLESMKGRHNIHILCKNAKLVNYRELVQAVTSRGRVDIAIFALLAPHLLAKRSSQDGNEVTIGMISPTLERSGNLLSYRPASRNDDDLVIWSLMIDHVEQLAKSADEFWHKQRDKYVATGFLLSNADRVKSKGLRWAPATPFAAPKDDYIPSERNTDERVSRKFFRAFTGEESEYARIDERGIFALWCVHEFDRNFGTALISKMVSQVKLSGPSEDGAVAKEKDIWNEVRLRFLAGYRYGAIVQPKLRGRNIPWSMHRHIAEYSGGVEGNLVVILGSNKSDKTRYPDENSPSIPKWAWRGVYEWPVGFELPEFEERMLWIS